MRVHVCVGLLDAHFKGRTVVWSGQSPEAEHARVWDGQIQKPRLPAATAVVREDEGSSSLPKRVELFIGHVHPVLLQLGVPRGPLNKCLRTILVHRI